ncbi:aminopeptidase N-like [Trifolium medium]|uniref:Aminopeptidase N-like n=1 Tax=Trifolium medium TaxID=97028 RepID=A0A392M7L5_9FABA|nr:aminopeptidase N-like [Trifolium medium]
MKRGLKLFECTKPYWEVKGSERFSVFQGMDLYFKRHDGQAVTCEDFFAAMRDANNADFANFLLWYSQAGTPIVKVNTSYNAEGHTFTLKISQEIPPTPGQSVKEPMFIPIAVGLLDSTGKDIPLSSIYHDGALQSVSSNDQSLNYTCNIKQVFEICTIAGQVDNLCLHLPPFFLFLEEEIPSDSEFHWPIP